MIGTDDAMTRPRKTSPARMTTRTAAALLAAGWALLAPPAGAQSLDFRSRVNAQVAAARQVASELGVHILELQSGDTAYSYNPGTRRILASNTKLISSAAALDRLGPGFFFETEVLVRGEVAGGALAGDLAIFGGGDPNLSGRHYQGDSFGAFREWAAALKRLGVRRIDGDLVLVHGLFDQEYVHPDWPRDQLTRWYEAPVAALSFNDNCVLVKVAPSRPGAAARVETVPPLAMFQVESTALTTGRSKSQWLKIDRKQQGGAGALHGEVLTVGGRIYQRTESYDKWVTVSDPVKYFGAALETALAEEGIQISGRVVASTGLPRADSSRSRAPWRRLTTHRSDLLTTLEVVNKRSQNFYAESVLKLLGAKLCGRGSWAGGLDVAREFLAEAGIEEGTYRLADGSGMSRGNHFAPEQLTRLLRHMFHHRWGQEFVRTLPYSGERDLKWSRRLAEAPYRGNVMAKTGYLSGVSTLSGYAKARSGKVYAFSILMNRIRGEWRAKAAQDKIVKALIDHG